MSRALPFDDYLGAVRRGDRREAFAIVDRLRSDGVDIREIYDGLFVPAQREIGRLWQANELSVAEEHLATSITQAAMTRVYDDLFATPRRAGCTLVAACADNERHELGLRMLCDMMELEGWDTFYLGASVPADSLAEMVRERRPRAVALSTSLAAHLPRLRETIAVLRDRLGAGTPVILVGGRPFLDDPSLGERIGADLTAASAQEAVRMLDALP